jgi:integrase
MTQLILFEPVRDARACGEQQSDHDGERLLDVFSTARAAEGAHPRSVKREVSQLRSVVREMAAINPTTTIPALINNIDLLARALREPATGISRATGRARLLAVQRFIRIIGPRLGGNTDTELTALDARLPGRRSGGWHTTGTLVAGSPGRRRRRGPTLDAADLYRLVDAAGARGGALAIRDRALVAVHCFTGLRPDEIIRLRWGDLDGELTVDGHRILTTKVERRGGRLSLLLPAPAAGTLAALASDTELSGGLSDPIFQARGAPGQPLSYRAARDVLQNACRGAGLPPVDSATLRAACAHWLRSQGLSDHEVAAVLGLVRVRSVDRLLRHHVALDAQRLIREALVR